MTAPTVALEVERIRAAFPALGRRHGGRPVAYFDGPGGTQVPQSVIDAMADYLANHNANTHWMYPSSAETDTMILDARAALADLLGASPTEVAFGQNMTTLTFHLARALARQWKPGDTIVVTDLDHHANVAAWVEIAKDRGLRVRRVGFHVESGELDWDDLQHALADGPVFLAIGAASNALGTITDVGAACALARDAGAGTFVDAVHLAPHESIDVKAIGCDYLACSPYKFYGPHLGVLYGRFELIEALDVPRLSPAPNNSPDRLETGTLSHEAIVGAAAAVEFIASIGGVAGPRRERLKRAFAAIHEHEHALFETLWNGLEALRGVRIHGPGLERPRTPTVSIDVADLHPDRAAEQLSRSGLFLSSGDFYAATVMERLGRPQGVLRIGVSCYTDEEEIDRLLAALSDLV